MSGWIKIHRKFLDWEWFNKSEAVHLFMYLVLKANHKDGYWQGIDISKGQFITSFGKISADTGISLQTIRTLLKKFEKTNEINIQTTNKYSVITICKYECYQQEDEQPNTQPTNKQQTTNKQLTTNKNDKNNKKFIIPTFNDVLGYCMQNNLEVDCNKFINFYESKGWMVGKNKMKDWKAAIRTWAKPKQEKVTDPLVEYVNKQLGL
jgi:hydroxymethylpyrimidine pyrophosphatase-like HAD family hydrolase